MGATRSSKSTLQFPKILTWCSSRVWVSDYEKYFTPWGDQLQLKELWCFQVQSTKNLVSQSKVASPAQPGISEQLVLSGSFAWDLPGEMTLGLATLQTNTNSWPPTLGLTEITFLSWCYCLLKSSWASFNTAPHQIRNFQTKCHPTLWNGNKNHVQQAKETHRDWNPCDDSERQ